MKTEQQMVRDWSVKFGQVVNDKPTIPDLETRKLRAKLIFEKALETITAMGILVYARDTDDEWYCIQDVDKPELTFGTPVEPVKLEQEDLVEIADGIADSMVVLLGTAVACGIDIKTVFDEVIRSNDSKLWTLTEIDDIHKDTFNSLSEFNQDNKKYHVHAVKLPVIGNGTERCWLVKDSHGKVIKSPSYSPANIAPLLK